VSEPLLVPTHPGRRRAVGRSGCASRPVDTRSSRIGSRRRHRDPRSWPPVGPTSTTGRGSDRPGGLRTGPCSPRRPDDANTGRGARSDRPKRAAGPGGRRARGRSGPLDPPRRQPYVGRRRPRPFDRPVPESAPAAARDPPPSPRRPASVPSKRARVARTPARRAGTARTSATVTGPGARGSTDDPAIPTRSTRRPPGSAPRPNSAEPAVTTTPSVAAVTAPSPRRGRRPRRLRPVGDEDGRREPAGVDHPAGEHHRPDDGAVVPVREEGSATAAVRLPGTPTRRRATPPPVGTRTPPARDRRRTVPESGSEDARTARTSP
jgi:hypothetical protein